MVDYELDERSQTLRVSRLGLYGTSIEDFPLCMAAVIDKLIEIKRIPRLIISDVREYEYDFEQTKLLFEVAMAISKIKEKNIISTENILLEPRSDQFVPGRYGLLQRLVTDLKYDPIQAYRRLLREIMHVRLRTKKLQAGEPIPELVYENNPRLALLSMQHYYTKVLLPMREILDGCKLLQLGKTARARDRSFYRKVFQPTTRPGFMFTRFVVTPPAGAEPIEHYTVGDTHVEIFKQPGSVRRLYFITPPEFRLREEEYSILDQARKYLGRHEPRVEELTEPERFRENIFNISLDLLRDIASNQPFKVDEIRMKKLADILTRYTAGLGVLELFLADDRITDILVNSPIGTLPVFIQHSEHMECQTNIFPSMDDGESWATRFRLQSGRPLDEANPVLDTELQVPGGRSRVAAITRPLSPDGLAFAFRRFRDKPWTYPLFVKSKMLDSFAAGLLWFIVDGNRTMLIGGTRGSGKTSFLGSCMVQIMPKIRIITTEDSVSGDSRLLLRKDGKVWKHQIGKIIDSTIEKSGCRIGINGHEIVDNIESVEVCSLVNGKIEWMPVKSFIRHKVAKDLLTIRTRTGREIKVTPDHSLFGLGEQCEIIPIKAGDLYKGSYVAVPRRLSGSDSGIKGVNLLKHLEKFEGLFVSGNSLKGVISEKWTEIKAVAKELGWSKPILSHWKRQGILPCEIANVVLDKNKPQGLSIVPARGGHAIPAFIEFDEDFLTLAGLWLGDGCYDKGCVLVSATDEETRRVVRKVAENFGIETKMHSDGWTLIIASKALHIAMRDVLGLKGNAYTKAFPDWMHTLSDPQLACTLRGLYSSDGYTAASEIGISLTSKELLWDIQTSLLRAGIISRLNWQSPRDKTWSLRISTLEAIRKFAQEVGFLQEKRKLWLDAYCAKKSTHDSTDIIPLPKTVVERVAQSLQLSRFDYVERGFLIGRKKLRSSLTELKADGGGELLERLRVLADGDVLWDQVSEIKRERFEGHVYDLSVPACENFVCENFIAHNTLELPVTQLREIGFNIERLKSRSVITHVETELPAEEALRTALRLGDSALILGEVRSAEALALYEAMRIGALANVVAGTIHGESAEGLFDRVVHDLGVPPTSFKATDIVVIANVLRSPDLLRSYRRITEITEVRKHWTSDPTLEGGFMPLMEYSAKEDRLVPSRTLLMGESQVLNEIANRVKDWRGNWEAVWDNINLRARIINTLVEAAAAKPEIIEAPGVVMSNSMFAHFSEEVRQEVGSLDSKQIYDRWYAWLKTRL